MVCTGHIKVDIQRLAFSHHTDISGEAFVGLVDILGIRFGCTSELDIVARFVWSVRRNRLAKQNAWNNIDFFNLICYVIYFIAWVFSILSEVFAIDILL